MFMNCLWFGVYAPSISALSAKIVRDTRELVLSAERSQALNDRIAILLNRARNRCCETPDQRQYCGWKAAM